VKRLVRPFPGGTAGTCAGDSGQIIEIVDEANRLATVEVAGVQRKVNIGLLDAEATASVRATGC